MDRILTFTYVVNGEKFEIKAANMLLAKLNLLKMLEEKDIIKYEDKRYSYFEDYSFMVNLYLEMNMNAGKLNNLFDTTNFDTTQTIKSIIDTFDFLNDHASTSTVNALNRHLKNDAINEVTIEQVLHMPLNQMKSVKHFGESRIIHLVKIISLVLPFNHFEISNNNIFSPLSLSS